jgi:hypothetical protein
MGLHPQGGVAASGFRPAAACNAERLLVLDRPAWIQRVISVCVVCLANRLVRTRMLGGVGGAGETPAPTRFSYILRLNKKLSC